MILWSRDLSLNKLYMWNAEAEPNYYCIYISYLTVYRSLDRELATIFSGPPAPQKRLELYDSSDRT